ncbi:OmpA-like transmembrane region [Moraxella macacae 0408225]|uniref:OmpA-like transmembrane region n=1 Tax=Moraxella macacae 0408225 TaxID=1230338 RepID=L2F768_9GAMM|nr:porin family protein [Moraxella macacae]ELA08882.1 OmpA-like transmembrane region [Moraxella macacae 0408225]
MKTLQKTLLALSATAFLATGANAIDFGAGQPYVGVKAGQANTSVKGAKKPTVYGVYGGYQFDPNVGVEAEYMGGDADYTTTVNNASVKGKVDTKTYGVYGTYKYNFGEAPVYAKGKVGIAKTKVEATATGAKVKKDGAKLGYGVGVGFQATPAIAVEAEYAKPGSGATLLTVGANFKF